MAGLGRIGKAVQAIISPGLAADTPVVQQKSAAKFPRRRHAVEEATAAGFEEFIEQVKGFQT
eukprot:1916110-Karenia_brevis.AAC.1